MKILANQVNCPTHSTSIKETETINSINECNSNSDKTHVKTSSPFILINNLYYRNNKLDSFSEISYKKELRKFFSFFIGLLIVGLILMVSFISLQKGKIYYTIFTNAENGDIRRLSFLNVDCGSGKALNGFGLTSGENNTIGYWYTCAFVNSNITIIKETPWGPIQSNNNFSNSAHFLDKHDVMCDQGYAIQQFVLQVNETQQTKIRYNYTCVKMNSSSCYDRSTDRTNGASFMEYVARVNYLSAQEIKLSTGQVLKQFQLKTDYGLRSFPYFHYYYTFCNVYN